MQHEASPRCRVVVLISGRGSNLEAIIEANRCGNLPIEICAVISNRPEAPGLEVARCHGIPTEVVDHRRYSARSEFDRALQDRIDRNRPDLVVLAGFMRVLGAELIDRYAGRLINIHPSLLPAFPGLRTHERALAEGAKQHGATVHFVTHDVDSGPIIAQAAVPVLPGDTADTLAARVLIEEHRIYPLAIRWFVEGRLTVQNGRVLLDGRVDAVQGLVTPTSSKVPAN
ncbi:MAG: phosphoribosylglycinamide formyltransferase [Sulfurifustis sp.]